MSDLDLAELRKKLKAATPGPWAADAPEGVARQEDADLIVAAVNALPMLLDRAADAQRLEDYSRQAAGWESRYRHAKADLEAAEAAVARVRDEHQPMEVHGGGFECTYCVSGRNDDHDEWPCWTVRALDGEG